MMAFREVSDVLGVPASVRGADSSMALLKAVEEGLPVSSLDHLARALAPEDRTFRYRIVPKASLARRQQTEQLSAEESERLVRLARIWAMARRIWGSDEAARDFLSRRHAMLDDRRPLDIVLGSELGAQLVEDVLGGLEHGTAA